MDIEKLIEQLRYLADTPSYTAFHDAKEREIICDQCEADFCYDKQQDAHWCMYEALSRAATALSTLQAENKRLNKIVCSIPTTPDSGRTVSQYDKEMSMCAYLDDLEAENEKLRADAVRLNDLLASYQNVLVPELRAELEQVKAERDAAISDLETIMAYGGGNLDTCQYCKNGQCYARGGTKLCLPQWRGQKED